MKFSVPSAFALALLLAACATPEEKEAKLQRQLAEEKAKHQLQLEEEARINFYALKARAHPAASPVATTGAPAGTAPLKPFTTTAPVKPVAATPPTPAPKPLVLAKPVAPVKPVAVVTPTPKPAPVVLAKPVAPVNPVAAVKSTPTPKAVALTKPAATVKPVAAAKATPARQAIPPAEAVSTAKRTPPVKPAARPPLIARTEKTAPPGDTIYLWDVAKHPDPRTASYTAAEVRYAHKVGKKPSQLTPAERQWVREHS